MSDAPKGYKFKIIHEQVASDDQFSDKTHEKAANVLYELITSSTRGMTVGVEGTWGSGKSTVVSLLQRKMQTDRPKEDLFFIFDAWAHEGDPLRRIFLESLIAAIDPDAKDAWLTKLLNRISNTTRTVRVKAKKTASRLGKLLFISTLFLPMGAALLSAIDYTKLVPPWTPNDGADYAFIFGTLFCLAPFILLLLWALFGASSGGKRQWDIFESEATERSKQDITEDGERTSIEFERYFGKVLNHIFTSNTYNYQKIIIVLDNLDRAAPKQASLIWATMQTFFQYRSDGNSERASWINRLWFLVPYDRAGLVRAWDNHSEEEIESQGQPNSIISDASRSFISKSIQIVVEVPTPVLSAWDEYCSKCVTEALTGWPAQARQIVIRVFQRYATNRNDSPTPRLIQNYVNQVGVNGLRWSAEMSPEAIALYSLMRLEHTELEVRNQLRAGGNPYGYSVDSEPELIQQELAGMLFGVSKPKGMELLLGPAIREALLDGDGVTLWRLIEDHSSAFWITWENIRGQIVPGDGHIDQYKLSFIQAVHAGMRPHIAKIKMDLSTFEPTLIASAEKAKLDQNDYASALEQWADLTADKEKWFSWCASFVDKKLDETVAHFVEGGVGAIKTAVVKQLAHLIHFLAPTPASLTPQTYGDLGGARWREWIEFLQPLNIELPPVLPSDSALSELAGPLRPNPNVADPGVIACLTLSLDQFPQIKGWDAIASALVAWANAGTRELGNNSAYRLMHKLATHCEASVSAAICGSVTGQAFWAKGNQEATDTVPNLPLLAALCLKDALQATPHVSGAVKEFWARDAVTDEKISELYRGLKELDSFALVWELAKDQRNALARNLMTSGDAPDELFQVPGAPLYLEHYTYIPDSLLAKIVRKLVGVFNLAEVLGSLNEDPIRYAFVIYELYRHGGTTGKATAIDCLTALTQEQWLNCFERESLLLRLASEDAVDLDDRYTVAFVEYLSNAMRTGSINEMVCKDFSALTSKLLDRDLRLEQLTTAYFQLADDALSDPSFDVLSTYFAKYLPKQNPVDLMERVSYWVDKQQWKRCQWIVDAGYKLQGTPTETLSSRVNRAHSEQVGNDKDLLSSLASAFNIEITKENGDGDPSDQT